jgi:hypothetical protein
MGINEDPNPVWTEIGSTTKFGKFDITVLTREGEKIVRAPPNLILIKDDHSKWRVVQATLHRMAVVDVVAAGAALAEGMAVKEAQRINPKRNQNFPSAHRRPSLKEVQKGWTKTFFNVMGKEQTGSNSPRLLEDEEEAAAYPDISAELPGVEVEEEEKDFQTILDEPEPDFRDTAAAALHNAGIDGDETMRTGRARALAAARTALVEADEDELVYDINFDVSDEVPLGDDGDDTPIPVISLNEDETHNEIQDESEDVRRYPTRARRSAIGNHLTTHTHHR